MTIIGTYSTVGRGSGYLTDGDAGDADLDRRVRQFMVDTGEPDYARAFDLVLGDPGKRTLERP